MSVVDKASGMLGDKAEGIDVATLYLVLEGHVLSVLNRDDIPKALEPIMAYMLVDYVKAIIASNTIAVSGSKVTSIKRGDTTIEYADSVAPSTVILQSVISKWMPNMARWAKARGIRYV